MIIKEAYANFGKLNNKKIIFNQKLNLISLPNEGGKSTWCAFILAMLYGFDPKDRDRVASKDKPLGYISERTRYTPWNGTPISGKLIVEHEGRQLEIRRSSNKVGAFNNFQARFSDTGEPVPNLTAENCGKILCGVSREAYERSAFIRSGNIVTAGSSSDLDKKINSIVTSGSEEVSADKIFDFLKKTKNKIRSNSANGELPVALSQLDELNQKITIMRQTATRQLDVHSRILKLKAKLSEVCEKLNVIESNANNETLKRLDTAKQEYNLAVQKYKDAQLNISNNGKLLNRNFLLTATEQINNTISADAARRVALEKLESMRSKASVKVPTIIQNSPSEKPAPVKFNKNLLSFAPPALIAVLAIVAMFSRPWYIWSILLLITIFSAFVAYRQYKSNTFKLSVKGGLEIEQTVLETIIPNGDLEMATSHHQLADTAFQSEVDKLSHLFSEYGLDPQTVDQAKEMVRSSFEKVSLFEQAKSQYMSAKSALDILSSLKLNTRQFPSDKPMPTERKYDLLDAKKMLSSQLSLAENESAKIDGELSVIGDHDKFLAQKTELEQRVERLQLQYDASMLAIQVLEQTNQSFKSHISPKLTEIASKLFSCLTEQKYNHVLLKDDFHAMCAENDADAFKSVLSLSAGTADQLYLALRLALSELILGDKCPPIILDDTLVNFDANRAAAALRLLYKISGHRQIIFFSCSQF